MYKCDHAFRYIYIHIYINCLMSSDLRANMANVG